MFPPGGRRRRRFASAIQPDQFHPDQP